MGGYTRYTCRSTSTSMLIDAKNPKDAAQQFVDELMHNLYTIKLKKCNYLAMKKFPDTTIIVAKESAPDKEEFFQYTSMKAKY